MVVIAGCIELSVTVATSQKPVTITRLFVDGTSIKAMPPTSEPDRIHGARRPKRVRVRSDNAPATGVVIVLNTDVMA